jgi:transposase
LSSYESEIAAGTVVVLYLDQCHLIWDDARGYIWGPSDQRLEIPIVNQRERQTYYGAIDALSGEMTVIPFDEANGYWTMIFVEYLRQQYEGKRLVLCWDGASYHRGEEMREYLEGLNMGRKREDWWITCVQFAPYAPEQNPIEDVWLQVKQYIRKHWRECTSFRQVIALFEQAIETLRFDFEKLRMYFPNLQMI